LAGSGKLKQFLTFLQDQPVMHPVIPGIATATMLHTPQTAVDVRHAYRSRLYTAIRLIIAGLPFMTIQCLKVRFIAKTFLLSDVQAQNPAAALYLRMHTDAMPAPINIMRSGGAINIRELSC
jgi:hypothetical protein